MAPRLMEKYATEVIRVIMKEFSYKNIMQVPKLQKIVVHVTLGEATQNIKLLDAAEKELAAITGQKPLVTKSKKAIAGFKLKGGCSTRVQGHTAGRADV